MPPVSVVIIAKNESRNIIACIESAMQISSDIIVADNGSNDDTPVLTKKAGAILLQAEWKGYGQTRNEAAKIAKNDWIFSLDADERITPQLAASIAGIEFTDDNILYGCKRESFLGSKKISFGEWGRDKVYRLYNRKHAGWNLAPVHEHITGNTISKKIITGSLLHYTAKNLATYRAKNIVYAQLAAQKYADQGKGTSLVKRFISPVFSFIQNYFFRLGFLDGKEGLVIAYTSSSYTFYKYKFLHLLLKKK